MKKQYIILLIIFFFIFIHDVRADFGDVNYQIEKTIVNNNSITFKGYAFIHKTNNYVTVYERNSSGLVNKKNIVALDGDQRVKIILSNRDGSKSISEEYKCIDDNYNFYYPMFYGNIDFNVDVYNNSKINACGNSDSNQCYYEDLGFNITFKVEDIIKKFDPEEQLYFSISVTNRSYREKSGKYWTKPVDLKISNTVQNSEHIEIIEGQPNGKAKFIANNAVFQNFNSLSSYKVKDTNNKVYGLDINKNKGKYYYYTIYDYNKNGYSNGYKQVINNYGKGDKRRFLNGTIEAGKYAVCIEPINNPSNNLVDLGINACNEIGEYNFCKKCSNSGVIAAVYSSWISFDNTNQLIIKVKGGGCPVVEPSSGDLNCNDSKTFNSTCDTLTIAVPEGTANVKIEQTGTINSILTPENIFAGGGFSFGVMYYNTIKWSYVNGVPNNNLHNAIKKEMEDKIYNNNEYTSRINIKQLKIGNKIYDSSFLEKKCTTSSNNKNYYNNELTVSCVFSFPESILHYDGDVEYLTSTGKLNINNKYYTPINYDGIYKLEAIIEGMSRITDRASIDDSSENKSWTGNWSDTFKNCEINLYSLLLKNNGKHNFIYRPIDISNPFPNRNAGINWYNWISIIRNQERLKNTYNDSNNNQYTAIFDNKTILDIKEYNKDNNYINWDSINEYGNSSFITNNNYIDRVGGN